MRGALIVMGGLIGAATLYLIVYEGVRSHLGLIVAGTSLAVGCLLMLASGEDEA